MKQINNTKSEVFLSTYDNSDILLPVSEEHENTENICVTVKFGDTLIKISPENTYKCNWYDAMDEHREELTHPAYWQMVGSMHCDVNQVLKMLGHEPIGYVWTDTEDNDPQYSSDFAWYYDGTRGCMLANRKLNSYSVRATKVFKIEE